MESVALTIHVVVLCLMAVVILYSDHQAYLYFRGKRRTLSRDFISWSHRLVWVGLILIIFSGIVLTIPTWTYRLQQPFFYVKIGFVLTLLINAFAIGKFSQTASVRPFIELSREEKHTLILSGALSVFCWTGATIIGLYFL